MRMRWMMLLMMLAAGCQSRAHYPTEAERKELWLEAREYNRQRLEGWDKVEARSPFALVNDLCAAPGKLIDAIRGDTPLAAARKMLDPTSADARREGVFYLADRDFGRTVPAYLTVYRHLALTDPDYTVRMAAVRALNRARDKGSVSVFLKALDDGNEWVRLEAAKALANVPDESAAAPLMAHLRNPGENKDVRIASADGLRSFPTNPVAQALIRVLDERDFGVAWQARYSLWLMSGQDFGYNQAAWLNYLTTTAKPWG